MTKTEMRMASWGRAIGIGIGVSILTAAIMVALQITGISPLPKALGLAFAETVLGRVLPLPVGLLFHTAFVTFWSVVYVRFLPRQDFKTALILGAVLWVGVLLVFFPMVGWGVAGLSVTPKLIPASLVPHLLFSIFLWSLNKYFG